MTNNPWPFDKGIHLRIFLKGIESSIIIVFSIITYELIKKIIEDDLLKRTGLPINYIKIFKRIIHVLAIFFAEILIVYLLIFIFKTEF